MFREGPFRGERMGPATRTMDDKIKSAQARMAARYKASAGLLVDVLDGTFQPGHMARWRTSSVYSFATRTAHDHIPLRLHWALSSPTEFQVCRMVRGSGDGWRVEFFTRSGELRRLPNCRCDTTESMPPHAASHESS